MICPNCNKSITDGFKCCPYCGTRVAADAVVPTTPAYSAPAYDAPAYTPESAVVGHPHASSALTFGILSLVFACTFFLSFLGIVFGAIGKGKSSACLHLAGSMGGKARTGRILSIIGLIVGIIMTAIFAIVIIAAIIDANSYSYYYYY